MLLHPCFILKLLVVMVYLLMIVLSHNLPATIQRLQPHPLLSHHHHHHRCLRHHSLLSSPSSDFLSSSTSVPPGSRLSRDRDRSPSRPRRNRRWSSHPRSHSNSPAYFAMAAPSTLSSSSPVERTGKQPVSQRTGIEIRMRGKIIHVIVTLPIVAIPRSS